ncbi:2Fe-2S iron-sulfur cluster-binding protein, partial [Nocardia farcinica]|uniref:2Fe-2S iron-sulfur cluster-binding protein n=1 Tax=Nocardia farcinica TaxID=37329 RepID=UPI002457A285
VVHHLSRGKAGPGDPGVRSGRVTATAVAAENADHWLLCGPRELVTDTVDALLARGVPRAAVSFELFDTAHPSAPVADAGGPDTAVTMRGDAFELRFEMPRGAAVLDAALPHREDLPYSCLGGSCGTCLAAVDSGAVELPGDPLLALTEAQRAAGLTLPCVARPVTDELTLRFVDPGSSSW